MITKQAFQTDTEISHWQKTGEFGTHTHNLNNSQEVSFEIGFYDDEDDSRIDGEIIDNKTGLSVVLSIEPKNNAQMKHFFETVHREFTDVRPKDIISFAEKLAAACTVYAEPCQLTEDAGYKYDQGSDDWILLGK